MRAMPPNSGDTKWCRIDVRMESLRSPTVARRARTATKGEIRFALPAATPPATCPGSGGKGASPAVAGVTLGLMA